MRKSFGEEWFTKSKKKEKNLQFKKKGIYDYKGLSFKLIVTEESLIERILDEWVYF